MLKRVWTGLVAIAVVAGITAVPGAARGAKHNCKVDLNVRIATVKVNSGSPPFDGSETSAGTADGKVCGVAFHGAVRGVTTFPAPGSFELRTVTFGPAGSTTATGSGSGTLNGDGSSSFSGTGKIVSGTGITKHATGSFKFTGTQAQGSNVSTEHVTGTLKF